MPDAGARTVFALWASMMEETRPAHASKPPSRFTTTAGRQAGRQMEHWKEQAGLPADQRAAVDLIEVDDRRQLGAED